MDMITDNLWIGSADNASDHPALQRNQIRVVLSIGCEPTQYNSIDYYSFPSFLDMPETNLLRIFDETTAIIEESIKMDKQVLVHCVYGQSRSSAIIAAYLILSKSLSLASALDLLAEKHSSICINPGFLSQLHLLAYRLEYWPEYSLLSSPCKHDTDDKVDNVLHIGDILCSSCMCKLVSKGDIVQHRENDEYMRIRMDPFWAGYISPHPQNTYLLSDIQRDNIVIRKVDIFLSQVAKGCLKSCTETGKKRKRESVKSPLSCPHCRHDCGFFAPASVWLCNSYVLGDLLALSASATVVYDGDDAASVDSF